ncbi:50S ribosomal protein L6 [Patescibacteria group bacterium]|nr:50S ribosomal protein L6 [Patescibacteria group bacterium]
MSRLGKLPINIPAGVQVTIVGRSFTAKGPKGEVTEQLPGRVKVQQTDNVLSVSVTDSSDRAQRALWGLARQLVANAVQGVHEGYSKSLELSGIGFKVQIEGETLVFNLGFSHPVRFDIPKNISAKVEKNIIILTGANKQEVGQVAAEIRALRKPEPYKGKGIKYLNEVIRRKAGKVVKAAGAK